MKPLINKFAGGGKSFNQAFQEARKAGLSSFKWNGGTYGTKMRDEIKTPVKVTATTNKQAMGAKKKRQLHRNVSNNGPHRGDAIYQDRYGNTMSPQQYYNYLASELGVGNNLPAGLTYDQAIKALEGRYQANVTGHLTNITDKTQGFIPVNTSYNTPYKMVKNYETGEIYATNPKTGEIIASSADPKALQDPSRFSAYHTGFNGDENQALDSFANNQGAREAAADAIDRGNQAVKANKKSHENDMATSVHAGMAKGANILNYPMQVTNHAIWGTAGAGLDAIAATARGAQAAWYDAQAKAAETRGSQEAAAQLRAKAQKASDKSDANLNQATSGYIHGFMPSASGNKDAVSGLGGLLAKTGAIDGSSRLGQSLVFTGDLAGNAALAGLASKGLSTEGQATAKQQVGTYTLRDVKSPKGGIKPVRAVLSGNDARNFSNLWEPLNKVTGGKAANANGVRYVVPKGDLPTVQHQTASGVNWTFRPKGVDNAFIYNDAGNSPMMGVMRNGKFYSNLDVTPNYNTTYTYQAPSNYTVPFAATEQQSVPIPSWVPVGQTNDSYVEYTGENANNQIANTILNGKPTTGEAGKDVRQRSNTTVNTSEGDINAKRSQGRKTGVKRRLISKTGRKDNSNK